MLQKVSKGLFKKKLVSHHLTSDNQSKLSINLLFQPGGSALRRPTVYTANTPRGPVHYFYDSPQGPTVYNAISPFPAPPNIPGQHQSFHLFLSRPIFQVSTHHFTFPCRPTFQVSTKSNPFYVGLVLEVSQYSEHHSTY